MYCQGLEVQMFPVNRPRVAWPSITREKNLARPKKQK